MNASEGIKKFMFASMREKLEKEAEQSKAIATAAKK